MTQRQLALIDERLYKINQINKHAQKDFERTRDIVLKYRYEDKANFYESPESIYQYLPDCLIDLILDELNEVKCNTCKYLVGENRCSLWNCCISEMKGCPEWEARDV